MKGTIYLLIFVLEIRSDCFVSIVLSTIFEEIQSIHRFNFLPFSNHCFTAGDSGALLSKYCVPLLCSEKSSSGLQSPE